MKNTWLRKLETSWSQEKSSKNKKSKNDKKDMRLDANGINQPKWSACSPQVFSEESLKMVPLLAELGIKSNPLVKTARVVKLHEEMNCRVQQIGSPGGFVERSYQGLSVNRNSPVKPVKVSYLLSGPQKKYPKPPPKELSHDPWDSFFIVDKSISKDIRVSSAHALRKEVSQFIPESSNVLLPSVSSADSKHIDGGKTMEESSLFANTSLFSDDQNSSIASTSVVRKSIQQQIDEELGEDTQKSERRMPNHIISKAEKLWMRLVQELRQSALEIVYKDIVKASSIVSPTGTH
jgi:hypothetical protein